jgi:hypothetical protein
MHYFGAFKRWSVESKGWSVESLCRELAEERVNKVKFRTCDIPQNECEPRA